MKNLKIVQKSILLWSLLTLILSGCSKTEQNTDSKIFSEAVRNISSEDFVENMGYGWNLGNTLDVCNADRNGDGKIDEKAAVVDETLWGNPETTRTLFEKLKSDGFGAVRIPVTWRDHLDKNNKIDKKWMDRVQTVVDWALSEDLYVIINLHHDGGSDGAFGAWIIEWAYKDYKKFYKRYSAVWKQICKRFENYSDHLIFESLNEVGFDATTSDKAYGLLNRINQDFVNIVRSSGKNNKKRFLIVAGYWTDITATCNERYEMPLDKENHLILSVHYYTPWQFCTCNLQKKWGTEKEVRQMEALMAKLNETFVSKGVAVIIGEYGVGENNDKNSCINFIKHFNELCRKYKIAAFIWDNGQGIDRWSEDFHWRTPEYLQAIKGEI